MAWFPMLRGVVGVVVFLVAIRLLGEATGAVSDELAGVFARVADRPLSALGLGWLSTYLLTNGSVVAALGVTLAGAGLADATLTVSLVSGSRLGAAAFVVMIGVMDHLRRRGSLRSKLELGILAFVVSHAVYVPATITVWAALPAVGPLLSSGLSRVEPAIARAGLVDSAASSFVEILGPASVAIAGVAGLFLGVIIFDRALRSVDLEAIRARIPADRRWLSFLAGLILTGLTSSVAFSIGVLVPLYNRSAFTRREIAPYVLGANVTTLVDTFVVSLVLRSWDAGAGVLGLMVAAFSVSLMFLAFHSRSFLLLDGALNAVSGTKTAFLLFLVSLLLAPIVLIFVGGRL